MKPEFFATPLEFRKWLEKNHETASELIVGYYKIDSGKPSITWPQSVDEALCFGWIDGIRRSIDNISYSVRFTPRRITSNWSAVNIKKVEELTKLGLMRPAGLAIYNKRKENMPDIYSYERIGIELPEAFKTRFIANEPAWEFYQKQAASYKKTVSYWVMAAKQEQTRLNRLEKLIKSCESGKKIFA
jgi:uncharacterized protein YdeI (YjbR/CyaY-like superfamily)